MTVAIFDGPVHSLDLAVGPRVIHLGLAAFDVAFLANAIEDVRAGVNVGGAVSELDAVIRIPHPEERMRLTLASPLAAIVVAIGVPIENADKVIAQIAIDYCGVGAVDDARTDQDVALDKLLAVVIEVGMERRSVAEAISLGLETGLGERGRGAGGPSGEELRLAGMTAKRD